MRKTWHRAHQGNCQAFEAAAAPGPRVPLEVPTDKGTQGPSAPGLLGPRPPSSLESGPQWNFLTRVQTAKADEGTQRVAAPRPQRAQAVASRGARPL